MIGIYKITSPSGKIYIGQSVNIEKRTSRYKFADCKNQVKLYHSLIKYGFKNHQFEVLCECKESELNDKERYYQDLYDSTSAIGLNLKLTTTKDKSGKLSIETRLKISLGNKGKKRSEEEKIRLRTMNIGKKDSIETRLKKSLGNIGRQSPMLNKKASEETKQKMRENACRFWLGKQRDLETNYKISEKLKGLKRSKEVKEKMSANNSKYWLGKNLSKEHKKKLSLKKIGCKSNACRILLDINTGVFYESIEEASLLYGIKRSTLVMQLRGYNKHKTNLRYA